MKPYSRFYQYTYVAIYRELQAAAKQAEEPTEPVSFEPIDFRLNPIKTRHKTPLRRIFEQKNVPKLAYVQFLL